MTTVLRRLCSVLLLSLLLAGFAQAQDVPAPVNTALGRLNQETGATYALGSTTGYLFREEVFAGNNLDCPSVENTAPGQVRGYVVQFDTDFNGDYEWEIRVSSDSAIVIVCRRPVAPLPTPQPGPALPTATPSSCSSLAPRIGIGSQARVLPPDPNILRAAPSTSGEFVADIAVGDVVTVIEGPRCTTTFTWWQVDYAGRVGWTVESNGTEYWMEPFDPAMAEATPSGPSLADGPVICDPALPPRLAVGEVARVTEGAANNVRAQAGRGAELVGEIPGGETFTVLGGPVCGDGLTWWDVDFNGLRGWTAEGASGEYFTVPPTPTTTITAANLNQVIALAEWAGPAGLTDLELLTRTRFAAVNADGYALYERAEPFATSIAFAATPIITSNPLAGEGGLITLDDSTLVIDVAADAVTIFLPASEFAFNIPASGAKLARFSNYAPVLATVDADDVLTLWSLEDDAPTVLATQTFDAPVSDVAFIEGGMLVAHGDTITLFGADDTALFETYAIETDVSEMRLAVNEISGTLVAIGATNAGAVNATLRTYDLISGAPRFGKPSEAISFASRPVFSADGTLFMMLDTIGDAHTVRFYDAALGDILGAVSLPFAGELSPSPDGSLLAVWDGETGQVQFLGIPEAE